MKTVSIKDNELLNGKGETLQCPRSFDAGSNSAWPCASRCAWFSVTCDPPIVKCGNTILGALPVKEATS